MLTSDFNYNLPKELIAQIPSERRDQSRLMVIDRKTQKVSHRQFFNIVEYLHSGDLLVWNNSKVFKARLKGALILDESVFYLKGKELTDRILNSSMIEIFLVRPMENPGVWKVLAKPAKKLRLGMKVVFAEDFFAEVITKEEDGTVLVQFQDDDAIVRAKANKYGEVPTPPYIKEVLGKKTGLNLDERYQTVYAKVEGSVAAPTAGFHFTTELIEQLKNQGIEFAEVTLHVGLGTFLPVKTEKAEEHKMHAEWVELTDKNVQLINKAKAEGRRVVVVGTTAVRALEGIFAKRGRLEAFNGDINMFILPGFEFKVVDALITNFHLPQSTLIMLVAAFMGNREFTLECYRKAVEAKYRFYSFGDATLIV
jgi:S-adenosylmethionine:tRNA ribosyltransferase-isomerase